MWAGFAPRAPIWLCGQDHASGLRPSRSPLGAEPAPKPPANNRVCYLTPVVMPLSNMWRHKQRAIYLSQTYFAGGGLGEPASVPPIGGAGANAPRREYRGR